MIYLSLFVIVNLSLFFLLRPGFKQFALTGYTMYRCDSVTTPGHAGVCVYVRDDVVNSYRISHYSIPTPGIDNLFFDVRSDELELSLGCIYRPRSCAHDQELFNHLEHLSNSRKNLLIVGDFNFGDIRVWPMSQLPSNGSPSFPFAEMLQRSSLTQVVDQPTRFRIKQQPTIPDLLLTNDVNLISDIEYLPPLGRSDHVVLNTSIQVQASKRPRTVSKVITSVDYEGMNA
ncbi:uncharacterized protein LOC123306310 [Coccinella septempunctata]|uniref:uncharacterized protein LOC123306310 n=1 Tax=Coccinella septempunctata TaxID=41139 RepID=UPI001D096882|nr:uncharacterized protein LOC123306310 [Coccinella septempunctata]